MCNQLPDEATPASRVRYEMALRLVDLLPHEFGDEIALVGSTALGAADEDSDIDLCLWAKTLPEKAQVERWLSQSGISEFIWDGESDLAVTYQFEQLWWEIGWLPIQKQQEQLSDLLGGKSVGRLDGIQANSIAHAIILRSQGKITEWKAQLVTYPQAVADAIVTSSVSFWQYPHRINVLWVLAKRRHLLSVSDWVMADLHDVLRILFAINREWEPDWKNLEHASRKLALKPEKLVERADMIASHPNPKERVQASLTLILDILELIPSPSSNVQRALDNIRACLKR